MKPIEVGFDGTIQIYNGTSSPYKIIFARSTHDHKGPDVWSASWNPNINNKIKNTFIWWTKKDGPELFYRNKDSKLFTVNFEPWEN